jgi:Transposase, Mutator family
MRFVSWSDRKNVAAALKPIYQAADADAARIELEAFKASELGRKNPHTVATFENAWAGSSGALLRRSPLRTGRASCPRIRLKQARWRRGVVLSGCCAARSCGRSGHERGVRRGIRSAMRVAGRR